MLLFFDGYIGKQKVYYYRLKNMGSILYFIIDMYVVGLVLANVVKMASQY